MTPASMATTIINHILSLQSAEDQRVILSDLYARFGWPNREEYTILTDRAVAEKFGVYVRTVQDWMLSGQLKGFKEARKWYTRSDWLREFEDAKAAANSTLQRSSVKAGD
ncbi:hypothetical protein [Paenibacillus sp. YIM B09110]|uniref:hypothetical protein n=1 Tax=Paenibacillus sp. YIM B09110 TaxID=3126102 RepID=UPI00301C5B51